jgi:folate-dependent tRNA-U54 methylase TrmFO/GidA
MNITFGLLPPLEEADRRSLRRKVDRRRRQVELGLKDFEEWRARYLSKTALSEAAI